MVFNFLYILRGSKQKKKIIVGKRFSDQAQNVWDLGPVSPIQ